mmetsp:Transcript_33240/g.79408  ORF Transcript_33240/g.79408 Transcript_33240/m.79408 type:complete len:225 (-) Transcript_33240:625-1299(-)
MDDWTDRNSAFDRVDFIAKDPPQLVSSSLRLGVRCMTGDFMGPLTIDVASLFGSFLMKPLGLLRLPFMTSILFSSFWMISSSSSDPSPKASPLTPSTRSSASLTRLMGPRTSLESLCLFGTGLPPLFLLPRTRGIFFFGWPFFIIWGGLTLDIDDEPSSNLPPRTLLPGSSFVKLVFLFISTSANSLSLSGPPVSPPLASLAPAVWFLSPERASANSSSLSWLI